MVFEIQMERLGGKKGDTRNRHVRDRPFDSIGGIETLIADGTEADSPDAAFQFNVLATSGVIDQLDLFADGPPLSAGSLRSSICRSRGLRLSPSARRSHDMGNVRDRLRDAWRVLSPAFDWTARDTLAIGIAALALGVGVAAPSWDELGYWMFSWGGAVIIIVGLWRVFVRDED